ncbi:bifunctional ADP-dependent NAD(P)H-hydrate dehydratase/NAD(P)H-hydrate epimerase [Megasphaera massiliensis]|uniref:bifunctional ADP-dependent NAD(P)H-hydrate dehydratase/NAD(P)H-hydrate epimerase n=1 Tax=Megasphaera massiliensis TaxID=1232428 RepID=UPI000414710D|nr:bifunctional ADP-dependent NAD(P)H-hydrate dehydratase/NAD(P)H-hydrate epimerase [Megasphaera massiliensis]MBS6255655.1 bifunctional ADP-dependent NAD(P)H-hydrate dehydratase/NAD(P)H-hydrate epimerase [Megasphaera sp.]
MKKINTAAQMRQMDYEAMHGIYAIAPAVLMENAGRAVAERAEKWIEGWDGKDVVIFCGKGNNGGDGFVIARYILVAGARAYVYILGDDGDYSDEARQHLHTLRELADDETCLLLSAPESQADWQLLRKRLHASSIVIDAMVGTGFHGSLRQPVSAIVAEINVASAVGAVTVIAVDMPTGVNADTGVVSHGDDEEDGPLFADMTVTFGVLKRGLSLYPGRACAGHIEVDSIGMPGPLLYGANDDAVYLLQQSDIAEIVVPRSPDSHKGSHGTIAVVTGSSQMAGAALMAAHGAVRSGAGKVFLRVPGKVGPYCIGVQPEVMVKSVGTGDSFTAEDAESIIEESRNWSVLAMGPGMGKDDRTREFLKRVLAGTTCPVVLDADALNLLAGEKEFIRSLGQGLIVTPHLAEFSRLSGLSLDDIKEDLIGTARAFAADWKVNLVLKGAPTLIVSAKTGNVYVNPTGNAGMACGGMGDILTGMIAAMTAHQGMSDLCSAACAGVYLHGAAGDACRKDRGPYGFTPMETADAVPGVLGDLEENLALPILQQPLIGGK